VWAQSNETMSEFTNGPPRRVALIGADGMLAQDVLKIAPAGYEIQAYRRTDLDITNLDQLRERLPSSAPDVIINCAAYTNVDDCEEHEIEATRINGAGPGYLAEVANDIGAALVHISSDYVFDGQKQAPYEESDATNPLSAYGRSKLAGEQAILQSGLKHYFILRTGWLYGPGRDNFVETILRLGAERDELRVVSDQRGSPTYSADLADAMLRLLEVEQTGTQSRQAAIGYGIYHVSNEGECSWYEFANAILAEAGHHGLAIKARDVRPITTEEYPLPATRPKYSVLSKRKYVRQTSHSLPNWRDGLARYMAYVHGADAALQGTQQ